MGKPSQRHGKKSDKETQSPMLKIIKEIMQREMDPEKAKLIDEKRKQKKRHHHSSGRSKSDHPTRKSCDSSGTEEQKRINIHQNAQESNKEFSERTHSLPFQGDKKESWWFWGDTKTKQNDETCSWVSCVAKRLSVNGYVFVACLLFILTIIAVVAFTMLFKTMPIATGSSARYIMKFPKGDKVDSEGFKRKIEILERDGESSGRRDRSVWDPPISRQLEGISRISENDYGDSILQASSGLLQQGNGLTSELSSALDSDKQDLTQGSERLKDFYKKLLEADAQIKKLKIGATQDNFQAGLAIPDRRKRSLFHRSKPKPKDNKHKPKNIIITDKETAKNITKTDKDFAKTITKTDKEVANKKITKKHKAKERVKRLENDKTHKGYVVEKAKFLLHYIPKETHKFPKCSHVPKETRLHEHQLNHPFYKNTQRLDEMLNQFIGRNPPNIAKDSNRAENVENTDTKSQSLVTKSPVQIFYDTTDQMYKQYVKPNLGKARKITNELVKKLRPQATTGISTKRKDHNTHQSEVKFDEIDKFYTTPDYDLALSVSTLMNPMENLQTKLDSNEYVVNFSNRKLLQTDEEDEENVGYKDLKEVLSDEIDTRDDTERKKRDDFSYPNENQKSMAEKQTNSINNNSPGVLNPNWKGPMPLYPDELNTMTETAAIQNLNKPQTQENPELPINTKDNAEEIDNLDNVISDEQYIEDYFGNKYNKLVSMAQAYSDYGVLDGKRDNVRNEQKPAVTEKVEHRLKMSMITPKFLNYKLFGRPKKGTSEAEGFKIKVKDVAKPDEPVKLFEYLSKHMKVGSKQKIQAHTPHHTTLFSVNQRPETTTNFPKSKTLKKGKKDNDYSFSFGIGKRSLKSVDESNNDDEGDESLANQTNVTNNMYVNVYYIELDDNETYDDGLEIAPDLDVKDTKFKSEYLSLNNDEVTSSNSSMKSEPLDNSNDTHVIDNNNSGLVDNSEDIAEMLLGPSNINPNSTIESELTKTQPPKKKEKRSVEFDFEPKNETITEENLNLLVIANITSNTVENMNEKPLNRSEIEALAGGVNITTNKDEGKLIEIPINNDKIITNITSIEEEGNINVEPLYRNETNTGPADFLMMLSNWFSTLAGIAVPENGTNNPNQHLLNLMSKINDYTDIATKNVTKDFMYPMYDSDMIDNIGHRSRVLMSVENENIGLEGDEGKKSTERIDTITESNTNLENLSKNVTTSSYMSTDNATTTTESNKQLIAKVNNTDDHSKVNKTLVKRNADDSNLIFWNDIYDEEYGIQVDPADQAIRGKDSTNNNVFMKKSGVWIQDKVRKLTDAMKQKSKDGINKLYAYNNKKPPMPGINTLKTTALEEHNNKLHKISKRDDDEDNETAPRQKTGFAAMTTHMKEVCKEAAKVVHMTRNLQVREESPEDTASTGIMQQLVKLMSDLVDYQVQLKTCLKLPPDLREFLTWLTAPSHPESQEPKASQPERIIPSGPVSTIMPDLEFQFLTTPFADESLHADIRSDYLVTLGAVEDLMKNYDQMGEEDKSKLIGIKQYLENQMDFLNKQLYAYDEYNYSNIYTNSVTPMRLKRHFTSKRTTQRRKNKYYGFNVRSPKYRRSLNRFVKNFGKKHTRSTASSFEAVSTEVNKVNKKVNDINGNNDGKI